ncbi:hypothetical protein [Nocardia asteroides]|uniref:hypothetical protein n=1 Tax=Nocardia asteroides TaxID=1824 RepID=UPI001E3F1617|nr:hypothetical protein [Nocardia asteroides]UGT57385.1 hypothetical protein LTT85_11325 [Nocardia asteroides]
MSLVWTLGVAVGAVAFIVGALNVGFAVAEQLRSPVAMALVLPVSVVLGVLGWMLVLNGAWRVRRWYLRRTGVRASAEVVESELRCKNNQGPLNFDLWRVRVEVRFRHPDSGVDAQVGKQYFYSQFRAGRASDLAERLSVGSTVPVLIGKNAAMVDIAKRPVWTDIW